MKSIHLAALLALISCRAESADYLLHVDGGEAGIQGLRMQLDGYFVGLVGDSIRLPSTSLFHQLGIQLPTGLVVRYEVVTKDGALSATPISESACLGATSWTITSVAPKIVSGGPEEGSIQIAKPNVRFEGLCPIELPNLACLWREAELRIHAVPEVGAEVWIDGVELNVNTGEALELGYCSGAISRVDLILRKAGYVSCRASAKITDGDGPYDLSCELRKL